MSRRPGALRSVLLLLALLLSGAVAAGGCTEGTLTGPLEGGVDEPTETREVFVRIGDFATWRDTTFTGYALPTDVQYLLAAETPELRARALLRYEGISDSVVIDSVSYEVERFENATIRFSLDTASSVLPEGGFALRLMGLARGYDDVEVDWRYAADGEPWDTPGGDVTEEIARRDLAGVPDSLVGDSLTFLLGDATDSLLTSWSREDGGTGLAVLVEGEGASLRLTGARLSYDAVPAELDTVVSRFRTPFLHFSPMTFIYDPPPSPIGRELRVGGLPASRFYFSFFPPDSLEDLRLRGTTVNRAELVFVPSGDVAAPFHPTAPPTVALIQLAEDPFQLGPKTPISGSIVQRTIQPDSLSAESPLRFDISNHIARWASTTADTLGPLHFGVRFQPDAQEIGFFEFGSDESEPEAQPYLRMIVTPPADLDVP